MTGPPGNITNAPFVRRAGQNYTDGDSTIDMNGTLDIVVNSDIGLMETPETPDGIRISWEGITSGRGLAIDMSHDDRAIEVMHSTLSIANDAVHIECEGARGIYAFSQAHQGVYGHSVEDDGVYGHSDEMSGVFGSSAEADGVRGEVFHGNSDNAAVRGWAPNTIGVLGESEAYIDWDDLMYNNGNPVRAAVVGQLVSGADGAGVLGRSDNGAGACGITTSSGVGVLGIGRVARAGVLGSTLYESDTYHFNGGYRNGVMGITDEQADLATMRGTPDDMDYTGITAGARGENICDSGTAVGVFGRVRTGDGERIGVLGVTAGVAAGGVGVQGETFNGLAAMYGISRGDAPAGVRGEIVGDGLYGVQGIVQPGPNPGIVKAGVFGQASDSDDMALYAEHTGGGVAAQFAGLVECQDNVVVQGDLSVYGWLSKGGGTFEIDHPLDPTNKVLRHFFVESPEMKNVYDGTLILDEHGEATVTMPSYFEALNRTFAYQLTAMGAPMPGLYIKEEMQNGRFLIGGGMAGKKVSWQVTGVRQDAFARRNQRPVEETKKQPGLLYAPAVKRAMPLGRKPGVPAARP